MKRIIFPLLFFFFITTSLLAYFGKDYKVKDVSVECLKNGEDGCESAQLNLTLQDGSSAKADKFDWE